MSKQYDSEGFMSSPLEGAGARPKDSYHPDSEDNEVQFRAADEEYQRLKADFARIARDRRLNSHQVTHQGVLHRLVDSRRNELRTCPSLESQLSTPLMWSSGLIKSRRNSPSTRSMMTTRGIA